MLASPLSVSLNLGIISGLFAMRCRRSMFVSAVSLPITLKEKQKCTTVRSYYLLIRFSKDLVHFLFFNNLFLQEHHLELWETKGSPCTFSVKNVVFN